VFSLEPKVDDDGVTFRSTYDGSTTASPRGCGGHPGAARRRHPDGARRVRTSPVVARCHSPRPRPHHRLGQARPRRTYPHGPVAVRHRPGRLDPDLRAESAQRTAELDFDGYGIGGLSVGETRAEMLPALAAAIEHLPEDRPRYLMVSGSGIAGGAVGLGVDQFDCVMQTRIGRHGTALTSTGKLHVKNAKHASRTSRSMRLQLRGVRAHSRGTSATCSSG